MTDAIIVFVTTASDSEAERIARAAVEARLAAAANVVGGVRSVYRWEGELETAHEAIVLFKTRREKLDARLATIRGLHSYEVYGAVALPVLGGNPEYLHWINESVATPISSPEE